MMTILKQPKEVGFTDAVRTSAAEVAENAVFIKINYDKIESYTEFLLAKYAIVTEMPEEHHFLSEASPEQTAAYILALDSINFGSGYFHVARGAGVDLEYDIIARGLKNAFLTGHMNTPALWAAATPAQCHDIFGINKGAHSALDGLMVLFAQHLRETGRIVIEQYEGSVMTLINAAQGSAVKLAQIVGAWPTFVDKPFYKRAQIFAADIHLAFGNDYFVDIDGLTMFADNMVPHVLRCDGVLEYSLALAARIDAGVIIDAGSDEEVELRGVAIHAVELMRQAAKGRVTSVNLDHILWNRGYEPEIYSKLTHRTMTVWY